MIMWKCYFKNLKTGVVFTKFFDNDYQKNIFMTKCRYSKKIKSLGSVRCDMFAWD